MKKLTKTEAELKKSVTYKKTCIFPHVPADIIRFLLSEKSMKANKSQQKRSLILQCSFAQKTLLILPISSHSTQKKISSRNIARNFSHFTNFPANISLVLEKMFALHHFKMPKNCITEALWFEAGRRKGLNNFRKEARCLNLVNLFKPLFYNFCKSNYFSAFQYFHLQH